MDSAPFGGAPVPHARVADDWSSSSSTTPAPLLVDYIDQHGAGDVVRPHYGVDQADRATLRAIVEEEFGDEPLDLVVDDARTSTSRRWRRRGALPPPASRRPLRHRGLDGRFRAARPLGRGVLEAAAGPGREAAPDGRDGELDPPDPLVSLLTIELVLMRASKTDVIGDIA